MRRLLSILLISAWSVGPTAFAGEIGETYKKVKGAVVTIATKQKAPDPSAPGRLTSVGGLGSGVLISRDGKVMTAAHVVQVANEIVVTMLSGESIPARVLSAQPAADVALLQLERVPAMAQVAELGDSDQVEVGDEIFVVGAPFGLTHSLSAGHVSARRQDELMLGGMLRTELFQTDAAINTGNSGGPMFDRHGRVVGIVSYILSQGGGFEGLGFVITSNMARKLLLDEPSVWSGLQGRMMTGDLARIFNLPQPAGLLVEAIADRSPATHLGLQGGTIPLTLEGETIVLGGDILLQVMGYTVGEEGSDKAIGEAMRGLRDGDEMIVKVLRGGQVIELKNYFFPDLLLPGPPE